MRTRLASVVKPRSNGAQRCGYEGMEEVAGKLSRFLRAAPEAAPARTERKHSATGYHARFRANEMEPTTAGNIHAGEHIDRLLVGRPRDRNRCGCDRGPDAACRLQALYRVVHPGRDHQADGRRPGCDTG